MGGIIRYSSPNPKTGGRVLPSPRIDTLDIYGALTISVRGFIQPVEPGSYPLHCSVKS